MQEHVEKEKARTIVLKHDPNQTGRITMTTKNQTLDLYLAADESQRLGLFLIHRDLREEFAKIERAEVEIVEDKKVANSKQPRFQLLGNTILAILKLRDFPATGETASTR